MTFRGHVALITGAASGLGQLSAWRLAAEGVEVAALDVNDEGLAHTTRRAPSIRSYHCDVTDWDEVQRVVKEVETDVGSIDRVVNSAAIAPTAPLLDQPVDVIARMMDINYMGTVHVTKAALPAMLERGRGELVNYASLAGWVPSPFFGGYTASKFAVVAFTETLAFENADRGVTFTCVCPPIVDTPLLEQVAEGAPDAIERMPPIEPEVVIDAVEEALASGQLLVFPGRGTRTLWRARRFAPSAVWSWMRREAEKSGGSGGGP